MSMDVNIDVRAGIGEPGLRLLSLIEALDCPFGLERSAKLGPSGINQDRFLTILHKDSFGDDAAPALARIGRALAMPQNILSELSSYLPGAEIVQFGYEGGDACVFKVYLEFTGHVRQARQMSPPPARTILVHLAAKWKADQPQIAALSRYVWPTDARTAADVKRRIRDGSGDTPSMRAAVEIIDAAQPHCEEGQIFLLDVRESSSPRRSFDVNVYAAGLPVAAFEPIIRRLGDDYAIEPARIDDLLRRVGAETLGHLSGGKGRDGSDFATLYFGATGRKGKDRG